MLDVYLGLLFACAYFDKSLGIDHADNNVHIIYSCIDDFLKRVLHATSTWEMIEQVGKSKQ